MQSPSRYAHAAAAPWSLSRSLNVAISPARRRFRRRHPGAKRRDPARPIANTIQGGPACARHADKRTKLYQNRTICLCKYAFANQIQPVTSQARQLLRSDALDADVCQPHGTGKEPATKTAETKVGKT